MPKIAQDTLLTYNGVTRTLANWAKHLNVSTGVLRFRIRSGMTPDQAFTPGTLKKGRKEHYYNAYGRTLTLREWSEVVGISKGALDARLRYGWTIEQTLSVPTPGQRRRGVVSNIEGYEGTGAGGFAQDMSNITSTKKDEM